MEDVFGDNGAEYSYIAAADANQPSVSLFTEKCDGSKFRHAFVLVHTVFAHRLCVTTRVTILKLTRSDAETLYRRRFSTSEFCPHDIDSVLNNSLNLNLGAFMPCRFFTLSYSFVLH